MKQEEIFQLYFIMGSQNTTEDPVLVLDEAIKGGITCFQYREKGQGSKRGKERYCLGLSLRELCREKGIPFIVNDDVELAIQLEADGIHVGQGDIAIEKLKRLVPDHYIIGLSTSTVEESIAAERMGVDYIGVGPIFPTASKEDALEAIGLEGLRAIRQETELPIVAIGGISEGNVGSVLEHGANGISVISAISQAESVEEAARRLRNIF